MSNDDAAPVIQSALLVEQKNAKLFAKYKQEYTTDIENYIRLCEGHNNLEKDPLWKKTLSHLGKDNLGMDRSFDLAEASSEYADNKKLPNDPHLKAAVLALSHTSAFKQMQSAFEARAKSMPPLKHDGEALQHAVKALHVVPDEKNDILRRVFEDAEVDPKVWKEVHDFNIKHGADPASIPEKPVREPNIRGLAGTER